AGQGRGHQIRRGVLPAGGRGCRDRRRHRAATGRGCQGDGHVVVLVALAVHAPHVQGGSHQQRSGRQGRRRGHPVDRQGGRATAGPGGARPVVRGQRPVGGGELRRRPGGARDGGRPGHGGGPRALAVDGDRR